MLISAREYADSHAHAQSWCNEWLADKNYLAAAQALMRAAAMRQQGNTWVEKNGAVHENKAGLRQWVN